MGRYSPNVVPSSAGIDVGPALLTVADALIRRKERKRYEAEKAEEEKRRREREEEQDRRFNLQLGLQGVRQTKDVAPERIVKPGTWEMMDRWEDVGSGYSRDVTTTADFANLLTEAKRRRDRYALVQNLQGVEPSLGLGEAADLADLMTRMPTAGTAMADSVIGQRRDTQERGKLEELAIGMGLTPAQARVVAQAGGAQKLADLALLPHEEEIRRRFRPPSNTPGPAERAIEREDLRRAAMQSREEKAATGLEGQIGELSIPGEPPSGQLLALLDELKRRNRTADSLAAARGLPPGAVPHGFRDPPFPLSVQPPLVVTGKEPPFFTDEQPYFPERGARLRDPSAGEMPTPSRSTRADAAASPQATTSGGEPSGDTAARLQADLQRAASLARQKIAEGVPKERVEEALERARQAIYRKYGIRPRT